jgi:hypothetical protein
LNLISNEVQGFRYTTVPIVIIDWRQKIAPSLKKYSGFSLRSISRHKN